MKQSSVSSLIRQADLAMYAAKRDGGACLRSFVPDLSNPYELPRRLPVRVETPTPDIDGSAVGGAEGLAPQRPAAIPETPRRAPLAVRLALLALLAGLVVLAFSTALRGQPGPIVLLDSWLESILLLLAAGIVARSWRVAGRAPGLATHCGRNDSHRTRYRRVREMGARRSVAVLGRSAVSRVLSACFRRMTAPDSSTIAVSASRDPN